MAGGLHPDGGPEEQMDDAELSGKVVGAPGGGLGTAKHKQGQCGELTLGSGETSALEMVAWEGPGREEA